MIKRLRQQNSDFQAQLDALLHRDVFDPQQAKIQAQTAEIIADVRTLGDQALIDLTQKFDGFDLSQGMLIDAGEIESAINGIDAEQLDALKYAAQRVEQYHVQQKQDSWQYQEADGTVLGQKVTPLSRVGIYVPGGKAAYPSSVLMNAIPAKVAGVSEIIMVTPTPNGEINPLVLAAASIAGVDRIYRIGGAQAVAALAYGTETIPQVDKITGPGNAYVAAAKQQVFGRVGIDMIAGPSEVLIIADATANPEWVAMDLFAQAEHDENAQSILLTLDEDFAAAVESAINALLPSMERRDIIQESLKNNGAIIVLDSELDLVRVADFIAAEHLEIFTQNADQLAEQIQHAGAIFIGSYSAESLGDYCAGPNHVLPTSGTARFSSPLGVYDFQKRSSIIRVSEKGAQPMAKNASILAHGESLTGHARSAEYRLRED